MIKLKYKNNNWITFRQIILASLIVGILIPFFWAIRGILNNQPFTFVIFILSILFSLLVSFCIFFLNSKIARLFEKKIPWAKNFIKRLIIEFTVTSLVASAIISIILFIFLLLFNNQSGKNLQTLFLDHIAQAILFNTIGMAILEFSSVFAKWKESLIQTEKLEKENILSQFEALKNQLNPHFMFNSLNALSSLIDENPLKAKKFLSMFSKIYRYILDVKHKPVVEINEELEYLNAYIFMQQIRFDTNLQIDIKLNAENLSNYVPPLSLQLLVENAIKHNEISNEKPLHISITSDNKWIFVKNNLNYREDLNTKSGVGLENLRKRIKFISDKEPDFFAKNNEYIAKIPFIDIDD